MSTETLKCTVCNADLTFTPASQNWICEWCDTAHTEADLKGFSAEASAQLDEGMGEALNREETDQGVFVTYQCSYCGAEVVTTEETAATFCLYCQRPVKVLAALSGEFKPSVIIPFKNTKEKALEQFKNFLKGKRFLPDAYCAEGNLEKLTGVYIPFWFYNADVYFNVEGEADVVTTTRQGDYRIIKTDTYRIRRGGRLNVKDVPVDASSKTPSDIMDSIEPYDFSEKRPFATPFLSGFLAERWDVSSEDSFPRAKKRMEGSAEQTVKNSLKGYTVVRRQKDDKKVENQQSKYGLLPTWLLYSKFDGKDYTFAMNGQTDKILGNLPMDRGKIVRFSAMVFAASGVLSGALGILLRFLEII
jgi:DNA-directed RNA polymerase subunit RPC12/RpoP